MTVFCWHMTALVLAIATSDVLGGTLATEPATAWWALRPVCWCPPWSSCPSCSCSAPGSVPGRMGGVYETVALPGDGEAVRVDGGWEPTLEPGPGLAVF